MIYVLGLGVAGRAQLPEAAVQVIQQSTVIIGSTRQLQTVNHYLAKQTQKELPPLSDLADLLNQYQGKVLTLLASGDPLHYGIGSWLLRRYPREQLHFFPAVSSIQASCHALGLALQDVQVVSLHGRPLLNLRRYLARHRYLLILTDRYSQPLALARELESAGYGSSRFWVCEKLGYEQQQVREFSVAELLQQPDRAFDALHISIIEVQGQGGHLPASIGIPDQHFSTGDVSGGGLLTKREVRMAILGLIQPQAQSIAWDIGAGCGGVAVEWALAQASSKVYAIEQHPERLQHLTENRERFGVVNNLKIIEGRAPDCLDALPNPQQIFIGGSDGELEALLQYCWQRLSEGGVLTGSTVTEKNRQYFLDFADKLPETQVETLQMGISKGSRLAGQWVYRPRLPVTLFRFSKAQGQLRSVGFAHGT